MGDRNSPLEKMLEEVVGVYFTPPKMMARVILMKLKGAGLRLSSLEREGIQACCEQAWLSGDYSGLNKLPIKRRGRKDASISLSVEDADELFNKEMQKIDAIVPRLLKKISSKAYPEYRKNVEVERLALLYSADRFRTRLAKAYRKSFGTLGQFIAACIDAGQAFVNSLVEEGKAKQTPKRIALLRLHHRACRAASEIECLLQGGFTDGAYARWRTLHEICVCAAFINKQSDDVARCFLDHERIDRSKIERLERSQNNPRAAEDRDPFVASLEDMYGKGYSKDYGWCAEALGKDRVTFRDLEEAADFGHVRLHYQQSNNAVHASAFSLVYRPSLNYITEPGDPMEWAIASNLGLRMPADFCVWSLLNATMALLSSDTSADYIVTMHLLSKLRIEVSKSFELAEARIIRREERFRAKHPAT